MENHKGQSGTTEADFLKQFDGKLTMSIGSKHSGKSYMLLHYIKYAMDNDLYDEYHLVLPVYEFEEKDSYAWLDKHKTKARITIYTEHDPIIIENFSLDLVLLTEPSSASTTVLDPGNCRLTPRS